MALAASLRRCRLLLSSPLKPILHLRLQSLTLPPLLPLVASKKKKKFPSLRCSFSSADPLAGAPAVSNGETPERPKLSSDLFLYNTMGKRKELFRPRVPGKVGMYVCGVTPYDHSHIGHARAYVAFDVLVRYLQCLEYEVCYVRNFTDIDDKIIKRANEEREDPFSLSRRFCDEFQSEMAHLQCLQPSFEPRVSDHVDHVINMIQKIIDNGYAYVVDGDVFFSVDKFPLYGRLSGRHQEDNRAGERVAVDERKTNPADFALWKSAKPGEPYWESPWGQGRPGWHIECSAMSAAYLGHSFDIHGGGEDLVFPHHENEIAQSCAACSHSNVSYWLHNGFVIVDSRKMSKSLDNFVTIKQVLELFHPLALRFFLLGTHYRCPINYTKAQLEIASDRLFYIYQALHDCEESFGEYYRRNPEDSLPADTLECIQKLHCSFQNSMSDDLNTPVVLAALSEPLKVINDLLYTRKGKKQEKRAESLFALEKETRNVLSFLGLMPSTYHEALQHLREKALIRACLTEAEVAEKIEERSAARKNKQYQKSDEIRRQLAAAGIALMDGPDRTTWRPTVPLDVQQEQLASTT